jgi:hypothetical protein
MAQQRAHADTKRFSLKTVAAGCAVAAVSLLSADAIEAHHSPIMFDTSTALTIKGTIVRFDLVNPHSYLYIDQETPDGRVERWAVEGPNNLGLERRGVDEELLSAGATIEACGYVLKETAQGPRGIAGRVLLAELVFMPDGEPRLWADYGNHHCRDQHGADHLKR